MIRIPNSSNYTIPEDSGMTAGSFRFLEMYVGQNTVHHSAKKPSEDSITKAKKMTMRVTSQTPCTNFSEYAVLTKIILKFNMQW